MNDALFEILGGAALLLWGLRLIRTGVNRAFGARLRGWLGGATRNRFAAFLLGLGATCAWQSSTATALMTASFTGRGLIATGMALAVLLGADVGTALVAQVLSHGVGWLSPLLIAAGVTTFMSSERGRLRAVGRATLGLGLLLLSLRLLSEATVPVRESEVMLRLFGALGAAPVVGLVIAALLTVVTSSSLAIILLALSLADHTVVTPALGLALVLGANLGGAVVPLLAVAGSGGAARRAPIGNAGMRLVGCLAVLPFLDPVAGAIMDLTGKPGRLVIDAHLAFNVALALGFLPLVSFLGRVLDRWLHATVGVEPGPRYLDATCLDSPAEALTCAARETLRLGDRVQEMLRLAEQAFIGNETKSCNGIAGMDDEVDRLQEEIKLYLAKLGRHGDLDERDMKRATEIISFAINLEHIGDIVDRNIRGMAEKKIRNRLTFSPEGRQEIADFFATTRDNLQLAQSVFLGRDTGLARRLVALKVEVRNAERESASRHLNRLREGRPDTMQTSALHLDVIRDLKRINAHIVSVAYPILEDNGELRESRLIIRDEIVQGC